MTLNIWWFNLFGMRDGLSLPVKLAGTLIMGIVSEEIVRGYMKFNKNLEAMKKAVHAGSDAEDDWIFFDNEASREQAYEMLYAETQSR